MYVSLLYLIRVFVVGPKCLICTDVLQLGLVHYCHIHWSTVKSFVLHGIQSNQIILYINTTKPNSNTIGRAMRKIQSAEYSSQHCSAPGADPQSNVCSRVEDESDSALADGRTIQKLFLSPVVHTFKHLYLLPDRSRGKKKWSAWDKSLLVLVLT